MTRMLFCLINLKSALKGHLRKIIHQMCIGEGQELVWSFWGNNCET